MSKKDLVVMELTRREAALISIIRRLGFGTLDKIGVANGEPTVVMATTQRVDLTKADEVERAVLGG